jgi:hypothetical protein
LRLICPHGKRNDNTFFEYEYDFWCCPLKGAKAAEPPAKGKREVLLTG